MISWYIQVYWNNSAKDPVWCLNGGPKTCTCFHWKTKYLEGPLKNKCISFFFTDSIFVNEFIIVTSKYPKIGFILISLLHRWSVLEGLNCAYGVHRFTYKCKFWEIEIEVLAQHCISCYFSPLILIFYIWIFGITVWLTWIDSNLNFLLWLQIINCLNFFSLSCEYIYLYSNCKF